MTVLSIPEMSCGHCKATIEKAIKGLDPAARLDFDMSARTVDVQTQTATQAVRDALSTVGYDATPA